MEPSTGNFQIDLILSSNQTNYLCINCILYTIIVTLHMIETVSACMFLSFLSIGDPYQREEGAAHTSRVLKRKKPSKPKQRMDPRGWRVLHHSVRPPLPGGK